MKYPEPVGPSDSSNGRVLGEGADCDVCCLCDIFQVQSVSFSPDGRLLASGSWDDAVRLWDTQTGQTIKTLTGHSGSVSE
jgi:WD40 repeat protein